jgi:uncharacterized protein (DUF1800 family)
MKAAAVLIASLLAALAVADTEKPPSIHMPWKQAGLTDKEAAAHLLNRFAFGPRPGEVDAVVKMGLERWFERQLAGGLPDGEMEARLRRLPALGLSTAEIFKTYPPPGLVLYEAKEAGILPADVSRKDLKDKDRDALKAKVMVFAEERGYRPQKELLGQLMVQKLVRAVESENQLGEVMTDFWFNHFNVSSTDNQARAFLLPYERDAIRPHALGRFRDLLEATAKSPAMLVYLDNAQSSAAPEAPTTFSRRRMAPAPAVNEPARRVRPRGVNENYARELMELHTLGVDGGYSQQDVVEVARAFTGWTLLPLGKNREMAERRLARVEHRGGPGFQREGEFLFRADQHDAGEKTVLGTRLPAGRGLEDGEAVLDLLAAHRATARHLAAKLAVRFVSDNPPPALVDRLADVYLKTGGDARDIRRLLAALVESPEFWSRDAVGAKIKSPFELAASALRASGGEIGDPRELLKWIARMGQPLYAYQAPTGYPDRAETWVNTGSLLNRMSFGLQLAAGRVRGIDLDWAALSGGREPESREEALRLYAGLLLPGRDLTSTLKLLGPMVTDPNLAKKVDQAAPKETPKGDPEEEMVYGGGSEMGTRSIKIRDRLEDGDGPKEPIDRKPPTPLEQVVGVILGSPEFQRSLQCQNRCRLDRTTYPGAEMRLRVGTIRAELQEPSGQAAVAAGERFAGRGGA